MFNEKARLIHELTGVNSSKLNYYVELKKKNQEIVKQNNRLEIIYQLIRDINIQMSLNDIIKRVYKRLNLVLPCEFLGIFMLYRGELYMKAFVPHGDEDSNPVDESSFLWESIRSGKAYIFNFAPAKDPVFSKRLKVEGTALSAMTTPLYCRDTIRGVLLTGSRREGVYTEDDLKFVRQLGDQIAICIQNTTLYKQVSRAKNEWEATFNAVIDPIVLIDTDHNIIRSNNRLPWLESTGGTKCYHKLWGRNEKCPGCLVEETLATGKTAYRRIQTECGQIFDIYNYPVYNERNQIFACIHHIKDLTEKAKIEAQLLHSAKLAAIGEMAAGVAHELNNPLTVIIGTAQMMLREMEDDRPEKELLRDIINSGLRCKKIIQNLLTFSRQDQQPFEPTDLNEVVERVLSLIKYQINKNKIEIALNLSCDLPKIMANSQQIQQVLINFLLNARDALEGVEREKKIEVRTFTYPDKSREMVAISVTDNGVGIEPENLSKIFNPFYTTKEATKGTGLGLSVSLGIAEAHGGSIEVESTPGKGSTFTLLLPVE